MQFKLPAPEDDGLFTPEVGPWSRDKHHFLRRYLDAFNRAMKPHWPRRHYIDLFAGAGVERLVEDGRVLGLDWGSPLIAAQLPERFSRIHLAELDKKRFEALSQRLQKFSQPNGPQLLQADGNLAVAPILSSIPSRSLCVAFLDPYGLDLSFETLRKLSHRQVDLIIYFPDRVDALRNWHDFEKQQDSRLDRVLGTDVWRERKSKTPQQNWAAMLSQVYVEQIKTLGYTEFEHERIKTTSNQPIYKLIFCSRDKAGSKIWRRVSGRKPSGQDSFDFGG